MLKLTPRYSTSVRPHKPATCVADLDPFDLELLRLAPVFVGTKTGTPRKVGYVTPPDLLDIEALLLAPAF